MVSDIKTLKSHPDKLLLDHIKGVRDNTKELTNSRLAELVAVFHDLGKINPNFQDKLDSLKTVCGYSNHAYLSAYIFFCVFACNCKNAEELKKFLEIENLTKNDIIALTVIIAKHHGNLPDFTPIDHTGAGVSILSKDENYALFKFLKEKSDLPSFEFVNHFFQEIEDFKDFISNPKIQRIYSDEFVFRGETNSALDFFIDFQFAFASVLQADKADAGRIENIINKNKKQVKRFSDIFSNKLDAYLSRLNQSTELNILRTNIRKEAVQNIQTGLDQNKKVFELTAPTGSGKTLMMLSLSAEIIKEKGAKRIIYGLPFLSITEQVEAEVIKIFSKEKEYIQRIDSKSENLRFEELQEKLDHNPSEDKLQELNALEFQENTFAYPFVITTFVRFFETILSNRNAELLKLPNFSNSIFLLDEIQALPPRLYGFFVAYLTRFCEKFNSYAIISTATQPNFELPNGNENAQKFFSEYQKPDSLLPLSYFKNKLFNRYVISFEKETINLEELRDKILAEDKSCLVILNTIDDTKELYKLLSESVNNDEILLLNTHFTPRDRKIKIYLAKRRLRQNLRIILISTQLIEAGVDIDFPILYRDFAIIPSIVQSAGRCNRNGKLEFGKVQLFKLENKGKVRSDLIYQGKDKDILEITKQSFQDIKYEEKDLIKVQKDFFNRIQSELNFAKHVQISPKLEFDFLKDIEECMYDKIGKFKLIDKHLYGEEVQYYVPRNTEDRKFETLLKFHEELLNMIRNNTSRELVQLKKKRIEVHLKSMANNIIQIRLKPNQIKPQLGCEKDYYGLYKLYLGSYSFQKGISLSGEDSII